MENHGGRAVFALALRFHFVQRPFQNVVCEIGHRTALSYGLMIECRDQMPFDDG